MSLTFNKIRRMNRRYTRQDIFHPGWHGNKIYKEVYYGKYLIQMLRGRRLGLQWTVLKVDLGTWLIGTACGCQRWGSKQDALAWLVRRKEKSNDENNM